MLRRAPGPIVAALALTASLGLFFGCATPTLPLPPPAALTASPPNADGFTTVTGEALPDAYVFVENLDLEAGVFQRAEPDGSFVITIRADSGHYLSVYQQSGTDGGPPVTIRVPDPSP